jgi:hypothetical protein
VTCKKEYGASVVLYCQCSVTILPVQWNCTASAVELYCQCSGTILPVQWNYTASAVELYCQCSGTILPVQWNYTASAVEWKWSTTWRQACPIVTSPPQISRKLAWNWNWASELRGWQPTIWASFTTQMFHETTALNSKFTLKIVCFLYHKDNAERMSSDTIPQQNK